MKKLTAQEAFERLNLPVTRDLDSSYNLVYTQSDDKGNSIYVFSNSSSYVITSSAEKGMQDVIGFGEEEFVIPVDDEELEPMTSYFESLLKQVDWCDLHFEKLPEKYKKELQRTLFRAPSTSSSTRQNITPLINENKIGQRTYWDKLKFLGEVMENLISPGSNTMNDVVLGNNTYLNLAGCGGTALCIVVRYWGDPSKHQAFTDSDNNVHGYEVGCQKILPYHCIQREIVNGTSTAAAEYNIPKSELLTTFNYTDMYSSSSSKKKKAMVQLFEYVTKACRTAYGPPGIGSSAALTDILYALRVPLGFDKSARIIKASDTEAFVDDVYTELQNGRVVIFSGHRPSGDGHTFVVDGYRNNYNGIPGDYFHTIQNTGAYSWYSVTPTNTTGVVHDWGKDLKAIIGIRPKNVTTGIIGDVNGDGYVNISDVSAVINYGLIGKQVRRDVTIVNGEEGLQFMGKVDNNINTLFFPLTGWKRSSTGPAFEKYSEGCYLSTYTDTKNNLKTTITRIFRDGSTDLYTTNIFACIRLVYIGNNPEADGAVDIGYYKTKKGKDGPERKKLYFAARNVGATDLNEVGDYFKKSTINSVSDIPAKYNINPSKWRLPTHQEIRDLFDSGYDYDVNYDTNRDGFIDRIDLNFVAHKTIGDFYYLYHPYSNIRTEHALMTDKDGRFDDAPLETTAEFKDKVDSDCYYGGFYKSDLIPKGDPETLEEYNSTNASTSTHDLTQSYYFLKTFYLQEVPKVNTVPIILGNNFTAVPWPTPLTGASIEVNNSTISGTFEESIQVTNQSVTETLQNYIVFDTALTQEAIVLNGITVTTLDGVDVKLTFTNQDFNLDYQSWNRVTQ